MECWKCSAVSGGEVIQDVPACFAGNILDDNYSSLHHLLFATSKGVVFHFHSTDRMDLAIS